MKFYRADQYQASCEALFFRYKREIQQLLPDAIIDHIGASSIPKAVSKGDLDIFVGVEANELELAVQILMTLGFQEKVDTLRTSELCMLESTANEDVACQVVSNRSAFECFLVFRDTLRANSSLIQEYNELKMSCKGLASGRISSKKIGFC